MNPAFLKRIWITTLVVGVVVYLFTALYYNAQFALGILIGNLWGVANFIVLAALLTTVVRVGDVNRKRAYLFAAIKLPVIYGVGYLILQSEKFAPESLLAGFSLLFLVTLLKALGRTYLKLDDRATTPHDSHMQAVTRS